MKQANTLLHKATGDSLTKPETTAVRLAETPQGRQTDNNTKLCLKASGAEQVQAYHLFGAA